MVREKVRLRKSLPLALDWLVDIAMMKTESLSSEQNSHKLEHKYWKGAIKGEYSVATKTWDFFSPIWHTGQAIKALIMAIELEFLDREKYLNAAVECADFILKNQIWDKKNVDHGLILAFEDIAGIVNTSAILECLDGLFYLASATHKKIYQERALEAVKFVKNKLYLKGQGTFLDGYDYKNHKAVASYNYEPQEENHVGRPLNDDSIFLKAWYLTKDDEYAEIFWELCEKLIQEEYPPGNWIRYLPCNSYTGAIHPRHAYWWGRPFLKAYKERKEEKYLAIATRAADWYVKAIRKDGGLFRNTYIDFSSDSFGHATSGVACAIIFWLDMKRITGTKKYDALIKKCLNFCLKMQFTNPKDENLRGCILEKVLPPWTFKGSDASPYYIRDLGTIFFIQAAAKYLTFT
ncbi:MAG: hypothetical protein ACTSYB_15940 [Candidatus Helarchaeota archaeon]